jgi:hypothetical protein
MAAAAAAAIGREWYVCFSAVSAFAGKKSLCVTVALIRERCLSRTFFQVLVVHV